MTDTPAKIGRRWKLGRCPGKEYSSKRDIQCKGPGSRSMPGVLEAEQSQGTYSGIRQGNMGGKVSGSKGVPTAWDLGFHPDKVPGVLGCDLISGSAVMGTDSRGSAGSGVAGNPGDVRTRYQ